MENHYSSPILVMKQISWDEATGNRELGRVLMYFLIFDKLFRIATSLVCANIKSFLSSWTYINGTVLRTITKTETLSCCLLPVACCLLSQLTLILSDYLLEGYCQELAI